MSCDPRDRLDGAEDVLSPCLAQERPVRPPRSATGTPQHAKTCSASPTTQIVKGRGRIRAQSTRHVLVTLRRAALVAVARRRPDKHGLTRERVDVALESSVDARDGEQRPDTGARFLEQPELEHLRERNRRRGHLERAPSVPRPGRLEAVLNVRNAAPVERAAE